MCSKEFWVLNLLGYEEFGLHGVLECSGEVQGKETAG